MKTIVTTDDAGTLILPADVLGAARPNTPYVVEADGDELSVRPQNGHALNGHALNGHALNGHADEQHDEEQAPADSLSSEEWGRQWRAVQQQVGNVWNTDKSAAEIIAEMRR